MQKRTLVFDVDEVICHEHFFPILNNYLKEHGKPTYKTVDCFTTALYIDVDDTVFKTPKELDDFLNYYFKVDSYAGLKPIDGATEALKTLSSNPSYEVVLATSCMYTNRTRDFLREYTDKIGWILENLPFINPKNIITSSRKDLLRGYAIVDDNPNNLSGDFEKKILFSARHNKTISKAELDKSGIVRANSWQEVLDILQIS